MVKPRVSVVIVNWKTPRLLARCLESVARDRGSYAFETWVVDNNSGDESVSMLESEFPTVKVIANSANLGFSRACNQAIRKAAGEHILLLNPDTVVVDSAITRLADYLEANPDCGSVGPRVLNPDGSLQLACRRAFPTPEAAFFRFTYLSKLFPNHPVISRYNLTFTDPNAVQPVDALSGACMLVRRSVIDEIGLLDEDMFMYCEEIDWCWRIKQAGHSVVYNPEPVIYHIHGASSRFRPIGATVNLHKGMELFYRKHLAQKYWPPFNCLVYAAIWMRMSLFILINLMRSAATRQQTVPVVTSGPVMSGNLTKSGS